MLSSSSKRCWTVREIMGWKGGLQPFVFNNGESDKGAPLGQTYRLQPVRRISARHRVQSHPGSQRLPQVPVSQAPAHAPPCICLATQLWQTLYLPCSHLWQTVVLPCPQYWQTLVLPCPSVVADLTCALLSPNLQPRPDPCSLRQAVALRVETVGSC